MASLSVLKADLTPIYNSGLKSMYVFNSNLAVTNGGCCCLWTVPDGVTNVTFELWGGGGAGAGARCCQASRYGATGGMYTTRTIRTTAGCTYTLCAGGSNTCSSACQGCQGCTTYVTGSGIATTCAVGGQGGSTGCSLLYGSACCTPCVVWNGGGGDFCQPSARGQPFKVIGCLSTARDFNGGAYQVGTFSGTRNYCLNTIYCDACCWGYAAFPAGPGINAIVSSGVCRCGTPGMGGMIKVTYG